MRVVVHGVGAIGGTLAAALAQAGHSVAGIARGAHLDAIRRGGLRLLTPSGPITAEFDCAESPASLGLRGDDLIVLAMKTQDTRAALDQLVEAGLADQPVFCFQNGVENERLCLRVSANVHGVNVMLPAEYSSPGEVAAFGAPCHGIFDIGRFPAGHDDADTALAERLNAAGFVADLRQDVMAYKFGKLLINLQNIVRAALPAGPDRDRVAEAVRAEGEAVLRASGIGWHSVGGNDPRREASMRPQPIDGIDRQGNSSIQSLARGTGSIETDYLNGEIVLLGRLHSVPVPLNAYFVDVARRMVRGDIALGALDAAEALQVAGG